MASTGGGSTHTLQSIEGSLLENSDTGRDINTNTNGRDDASIDNIQSHSNLEEDIRVDTRQNISPEITVDSPSTQMLLSIISMPRI